MKIMLKVVSGTLLACLLLAAGPARSAIDLTGHDTDLFTTNPNIPAQVPNVLIVLDNTSNWSRSSEGWPSISDADCTRTDNTQGDAQLCAIQKTIKNPWSNASPMVNNWSTRRLLPNLASKIKRGKITSAYRGMPLTVP